MNEKLFNFFSKKVGSAKIDGCEYAFCHPLQLETDEKGGLLVTCTAVDKEGYFYNLWWLPWACFPYDDWGNPVIKRIGKYEELPVKNVQEIISYFDRIG